MKRIISLIFVAISFAANAQLVEPLYKKIGEQKLRLIDRLPGEFVRSLDPQVQEVVRRTSSAFDRESLARNLRDIHALEIAGWGIENRGALQLTDAIGREKGLSYLEQILAQLNVEAERLAILIKQKVQDIDTFRQRSVNAHEIQVEQLKREILKAEQAREKVQARIEEVNNLRQEFANRLSEARKQIAQQYQLLAASSDPLLRAIAYNNLAVTGLASTRAGEPFEKVAKEDALNQLRNAVHALTQLKANQKLAPESRRAISDGILRNWLAVTGKEHISQLPPSAIPSGELDYLRIKHQIETPHASSNGTE